MLNAKLICASVPETHLACNECFEYNFKTSSFLKLTRRSNVSSSFRDSFVHTTSKSSGVSFDRICNFDSAGERCVCTAFAHDSESELVLAPAHDSACSAPDSAHGRDFQSRRCLLHTGGLSAVLSQQISMTHRQQQQQQQMLLLPSHPSSSASPP